MLSGCREGVWCVWGAQVGMGVEVVLGMWPVMPHICAGANSKLVSHFSLIGAVLSLLLKQQEQ